MPAFAFATERDDLVVLALIRLFDDLALLVELDSVHVLDVGEPAPGGEQAIGGSAAVLVAEHHRVAQTEAARGLLPLVPHEQRQIGETSQGVRPRVENGGEGDRGILWM